MIIREAKETDLPHLIIIKNNDETGRFLKRIEETKEKKAAYLIADDNGSIVGHVFLKYYGSSHSAEYPSIEDLAVRIDQRGKGIGSALMAECEKRVKEKGFSKIGISVNPDPTCPANRLYTKLGYKIIENKPYVDGVYNGAKDWVIDMVKEI